MLYLLKKENGSDAFLLTRDKEYIIGRKNADIVISDDQSISRKHAVIKVGNNFITLMDCGSKYGTLHNNKKMTPNSKVSLSDKDAIKFGVFQSGYTLEKLAIVTTGSALSNKQKDDLKSKINQLGGSVINDWDDSCTAVTAEEIILTVKVLHAIVDQKPIVTLQYWDEFIKNVNSSKPPPNSDNFKPPMAEALINIVQLSANPERKGLFKGKTFVFTSEKIRKKMADLIVKTGGSSISWERQHLTIEEVTKSKTKYLFIHNKDPDDIPRSLKDLRERLNKLGERMIPIQEIAMAMVLCSCEKDCNPKFNRVDKVFQQGVAFDSCSMTPLVENTPSDDAWVDQVVTKKELIIPQSLDAELEIFLTPATPSGSGLVNTSTHVASNPLKRVEKEPEDHPPKRIKLHEEPRKETIVSCDVVENETLKSILEIRDSTVSEQFIATPSTSKSTPECRKRKSEDDLDFTSKRPFAVTRNKRASRNSEINPFVALRVKEETNNDDESNPFLQILNQKKEPTAIPVPQSPIQAPLDFVKDNYVPTETPRIEWLSIIKNECDETNENVSISTGDPEVDEIFEKFKNTVVIEKLPVSAIRKLAISESVSLDNTSGKKNFKKFRKVRPRHPQTTILGTSVYADATTGTQMVIRSDGEEEDGEESEVVEVTRRPKKTTRAKRFDF